MNEHQQIFAKALNSYVGNGLLNDRGWTPLQAIAEGKLATIKIGMVGRRFHIVAIECADVATLEKELKEAKKTVKTLEKQNEALTGQITDLPPVTTQPEEPETTAEETAEITEESPRTRRKRKT